MLQQDDTCQERNLFSFHRAINSLGCKSLNQTNVSSDSSAGKIHKIWSARTILHSPELSFSLIFIILTENSIFFMFDSIFSLYRDLYIYVYSHAHMYILHMYALTQKHTCIYTYPKLNKTSQNIYENADVTVLTIQGVIKIFPQ